MPSPLPPTVPHAWREQLEGWSSESVEDGMGGAALFRLSSRGEVRYLKLAVDQAASDLRDEIVRTAWLAAQSAPVPRIVQTHDDGASVCMLMEALPGSTAEHCRAKPAALVPALARALAALHALPVRECPFEESIAIRLGRAAQAIQQGEIDGEDFDDRNRGVAPAALLARLQATRPTEDCVVVHGDATLANMIVGPDLRIGFIDCGRAGRADPYVDLAVAADGIAERFGARWRSVFARAYGDHAWDRRKARYFSDLYELF